ncbi:response regulator [Desulforegula conservatrix]|uniref:response regulator n=1 Tax=Desulforegula conservatrix TaxID=153026 RepID=UPI0004833D16|nr:response regulator [Desulforegula conservatrix]
MKEAENRIIVVDDDSFAAELIGMALESAGFEVIMADGGIDALEKISVDPSIKIIVSDMNMPLINGAELFEELRQNGFNQPFLLLTGEDPEALLSDHPYIDAILAKDENMQEALPSLIKALISKAEAKETK